VGPAIPKNLGFEAYPGYTNAEPAWYNSEDAVREFSKDLQSGIAPEIVDVSQDQIKSVNFNPYTQKTPVFTPPTGVGGSRVSKRKHQITALAFDARQREFELAEKRSSSLRTKAETYGKYGW